MVKNVNIVGAGLAGSLVAHCLQFHGIRTNLIDDGDSRAASPASSNLFIESWLRKFPGTEAKSGLYWLDLLFGPNPQAIPATQGQIEKPFSSGLGDAIKVRHIAQRNILQKPDVDGVTLRVDTDGVDVRVKNVTVHIPGPTVVCTGYRGAELVPGLKDQIHVKVGHAYFFDGFLAPGQSRLALAPSLKNGVGIPFRHEKLYQFDAGTIYYADSVAVSPERYEKDKVVLQEETLQRARKLIGPGPKVRELRIGYRPFIDGADFGYGDQVKPGVWVLNGGGKNGMVAYAHKASVIAQQIKDSQ